MILDIFETFFEQFQIWLAESPAIPSDNDNVGPRCPYEGWQG